MLIDIDKIIVKDRIRKDYGDIDTLAESIEKYSLLNPLTVTPSGKGDGTYILLAGERRLRACKKLGYTSVIVNTVSADSDEAKLAIEMDENTARQNFTGHELANGIRKQLAIETEKAKERMLAGKVDPRENFPKGSGGRATDKAAEQFGISGKQAEKVLFVDDHRDLLDPSDFADWDEGKLSTNKVYKKLKAQLDEAKEKEAASQVELGKIRADLQIKTDELKAVQNRPPKVVEKEVKIEPSI